MSVEFIYFNFNNNFQIIKIDQTINKIIKERLSKKFCITPLKQSNIEPTVTLSMYPPKDKNTWKKHIYETYKDCIIYYKIINDKLYFYIQKLYVDDLDEFRIYSLALNSMLVSHILKYEDIIYLHAILLSNGDVIFGKSLSGKSTIAERIKNNNTFLHVICDNGVIIDIKNKNVYPISWAANDGEWYKVNFNNPYKLNNIYSLQQSESIQEVMDMNYYEYISALFKSSIFFLFHPFYSREENEPNKEGWISFNVHIQNKIEQIITNLINSLNLTPKCLYTNTNDCDKKFEAIPDICIKNNK